MKKDSIKILNTLNRVHLTNRQSMLLKSYIRSLVNTTATALKLNWGDGWKDTKHFPIELDKDRLWSTYDDCFKLSLILVDGTLKFDITVYNRSWDGQRNGIYWHGTFCNDIDTLPQSDLLDEILMAHFTKYVGWKYEEYLEQQRGNWIHNFIEEFFNNN